MGHVILLYHQTSIDHFWKESLELLLRGWDTFMTSWCNSQKQQRPTIRYYCKQQQPPFGCIKTRLKKKTGYSYHINWFFPDFWTINSKLLHLQISSSWQISYQETNINVSWKTAFPSAEPRIFSIFSTPSDVQLKWTPGKRRRRSCFSKLVGGFFQNPFEKYDRQIGWKSSPIFVVKIKHIWVATTQKSIMFSGSMYPKSGVKRCIFDYPCT